MQSKTHLHPGEFTRVHNFADLENIYFDRKTGQYRDRKSKQPVSREQLFELTRQNIATQQQELMGLAGKLADGSLSLRNFQFTAGELLRRIHVQSAVLGRGGKEKMKPGDWLQVGRELLRQYLTGKDKSGKRFGLKYLAKDIQAGAISVAQLRNSLRLYSESGKTSYWQALKTTEKELGRLYAIRVLGIAEHCDDCLRYSTLPPQPIDQIILPTQQCACMNSCKCRILTLTLEAIH
jgi:hypothetical protein